MIHLENKSCFLLGKNRFNDKNPFIATDKVNHWLKAEDVLAVVSYNLVFALNKKACIELFKLQEKTLNLYEIPDYCVDANMAMLNDDFLEILDNLFDNGCFFDENIHKPILWFMSEGVHFTAKHLKPQEHLLGTLIYLNRDSGSLLFSMKFEEKYEGDIMGFVLGDYAFALNCYGSCELFGINKDKDFPLRPIAEGENASAYKVIKTPEFAKMVQILSKHCVVDNSVYIPALKWKTNNSDRIIY